MFLDSCFLIDLLIAATALEGSEPLVTNNPAHFGRIVGLELLDYTSKR